jgi:hypothetical protein
MHSLPCTIIAGRHEADRRRAAIDQSWRILQEHARTALDKTLRLFGLRTNPHFHVSPLSEEPSLWAWCRLATARADHDFIYAVLDEQGWKTDPARLSRFSVPLDVIRLRHAPTDATLVLIIKIPTGEAPHLEAA